MEKVTDLASKKAAVIFTKSSCCMCHSIKALFYELGASPAIHELDKDSSGREMEWALQHLGCSPSVPAVFIGGRCVGSAKDVISLHVNGSLKQKLIEAGAIWFYTLFKCDQNIELQLVQRSVEQSGIYLRKNLDMDKITRMISENGVVIFSKSTCCLSYAVNILFQGLGVTPLVHEIDQDPDGREMENALLRMGCNGPVPAVFISGRLMGSTHEVMSLHLKGSLTPLLKPYQPVA
ncbi:hypothetical protein RJ640_019860 [Escallonia rubra]|uniref:Glutaredoxin domain-containing protein n=1 Tax=Escallonia rubra TaxID=112253 RepID=A0AA88SH91_9ASTE|nr:hypothetical protein RJ640_019860 [Escallonia rubra]